MPSQRTRWLSAGHSRSVIATYWAQSKRDAAMNQAARIFDSSRRLLAWRMPLHGAHAAQRSRSVGRIAGAMPLQSVVGDRRISRGASPTLHRSCRSCAMSCSYCGAPRTVAVASCWKRGSLRDVRREALAVRVLLRPTARSLGIPAKQEGRGVSGGRCRRLSSRARD